MNNRPCKSSLYYIFLQNIYFLKVIGLEFVATFNHNHDFFLISMQVLEESIWPPCLSLLVVQSVEWR